MSKRFEYGYATVKELGVQTEKDKAGRTQVKEVLIAGTMNPAFRAAR